MIADQCFSKEWITQKRAEMGSVDPALLEKSIYGEFPASLRSGKKFAEGKSEGQTFPKPPACREAGSG